MRASTEQSLDLANQLSVTWLQANLDGWNNFKNMMEKYNAFVPGKTPHLEASATLFLSGLSCPTCDPLQSQY